ncbi:MAG: hypothetical protein H6931_17640 [Burkholderiaceae bacterium]|nr:hypothetical protein [Zoogloeaceae bacterium]MCP5290914.1 hypothetical protein [Burkholderiaceae bacterium]
MSRCDHPQAWFEEGKTAGAAGADRESCPYRRTDKRAHWLRGWVEGHEAREVARVHREPRDPRDELVGRVALAHLREVLR